MVWFSYLFLEGLTDFAEELQVQMPGFCIPCIPFFKGDYILNYIEFGYPIYSFWF